MSSSQAALSSTPETTEKTLAQRLFKIADQDLFAKITGDVNPLHMDKIRARRTIIGEIAVHGMHTLLWSLDILAKSAFRPEQITHLDVRFPKPLHLDETVSILLTKATPSTLHLRAIANSKTVAQIKIGIAPSSTTQHTLPALVEENLLHFSFDEKPLELVLDQALGMHGDIEHTVPPSHYVEHYPEAAELLGAPVLRALGACSRLVGMICPGSQSIFSRLNIEITYQCLDKPVSYKVIGIDDRFRLVRHSVKGSGIAGQVEAFAPPPPPQQMALSDIQKHLKKSEFSGQRALVIGGSRGLGELTAKIIAAGEGEVLLTYARGKEDAENVVKEIRSAGGKAAAQCFDIDKDISKFAKDVLNFKPTHVYYFATCRIAEQKNGHFKSDRLATFMKYYVHSFWALCHDLSQMSGIDKLSVYYPSSVYVTERPPNMTEYAMAKAAGEILCADIPAFLPHLSVTIQRLPKLLTDQTNVVTQQNLPNPLDILLPTFRRMQ